MKRVQNGKPESSTTKKLQKKTVTKTRRQAEKKDPQNAPTKNAYKGCTN